MALGFTNPGSIDIYELSEDYYLGTKELRSSFGPSSNLTQQDAFGVKLSETGDYLVASFGGLEKTTQSTIQAAYWNGASYIPRGKVLLETQSTIFQRQLAISSDGVKWDAAVLLENDLCVGCQESRVESTGIAFAARARLHFLFRSMVCCAKS